jgi:hypothetical protein
LVLTNDLFELKASIKVTYPPDQDSQKNGAQNDQKERERNFLDFKPLIIFCGENETKGDLTSILNGKKDRHEKGQHPKQCLDPSHFFILLSGLSSLAKDP